MHFGLGEVDGIERVEVRWPNRAKSVEVFEGVELDAHQWLVEGEGRAKGEL